ncbi:MAG: tRNA (adenosine(37)-N6)-threonylcarbamoyltransferase complex transferase subunit TsaD [Candidatus Saccharibacteria bacterium]|nr:tRNA (adenosine(37)-N6)-threonylcarbamoyltransferase complex transferase subunit TsaD [Candidatus Saccharibacteria bacterium]
MKILGIETSCDETAAAVVEDGRKLLSNVIVSQIDIHAVYGGVVPEVAARSHIEVINPVINQALTDANCTWDDIDAIAVTYAPGLIGSLLIGMLAARTLAVLHKKPIYPVHHVEAHVYANFLNETAPEFPMLALIVSGGHSQLVLFHNHGNYELIGQTCDDAVGEAFDKVAKIIGLPYPGGPSIGKAALNGNPLAYKLPKAKLAGKYDFSFSGLKTATLRAVQREVGVDFTFPSTQLAERLDDRKRNDFAASFQRTAIETLVDQTEKAFNDYHPKSVVIAGGVAANQELRRILSDRIPLHIDYAPMNLCTDNAAMIASLGFYFSQKNVPADPFELEVEPSISMTKTAWDTTS